MERDFATAVATHERTYKYLRVKDTEGTLRKMLLQVAKNYDAHLYEYEKDPSDLLRFLITHAATCVKAVRPEPILEVK